MKGALLIVKILYATRRMEHALMAAIMEIQVTDAVKNVLLIVQNASSSTRLLALVVKRVIMALTAVTTVSIVNSQFAFNRMVPVCMGASKAILDHAVIKQQALRRVQSPTKKIITMV